jgi:hypothetical protein
MAHLSSKQRQRRHGRPTILLLSMLLLVLLTEQVQGQRTIASLGSKIKGFGRKKSSSPNGNGYVVQGELDVIRSSLKQNYWWQVWLCVSPSFSLSVMPCSIRRMASLYFLCLSILFESFVDFHALLLIVSSLESVYCCFIL